MKRITLVAGARPNFMKIAPLIHEIQKQQSNGLKWGFRLVHTGQHYDKKMSDDFFDQLQIPQPDVNLAAGGGSQAEQTAQIMLGFERELLSNPSDLVLVVGDVTSTMACAIVAQKMHTKVAHVEAGIRSGDWKMPEEINRLVTDAITDYFFTTSEFANEHLRKSGVDESRIFFVGNTMIDTLLKQQPNFRKPTFWEENQLKQKSYLMLTLHRPDNVDDENKLGRILDEILQSSGELPVLFPTHPRTEKMLQQMNFSHPNLHIFEPMPYLEFNYLVENSLGVITDSGGITEEATVMGVPCMTLRNTTERPETVTQGTNELIGTNSGAIRDALKALFAGNWKKGSIPPLWDGKAAERIIASLINLV